MRSITLGAESAAATFQEPSLAGGLSLREGLILASSLFAIGGGVELVTPSASQALGEAPAPVTAAAKPPYCDYPDHYLPGICGVPKQQVTDNCAEQAYENNNDSNSIKLRVSFDKASGTFKRAFFESPMGGCTYAGNRQVTQSTQVEQGPNGPWVQVGKASTVTANGAYKVKKTSHETLTCPPAVAGSAIREVVSVKFIPKRGWGKVPKVLDYPDTTTPIPQSHDSKSLPIC